MGKKIEPLPGWVADKYCSHNWAWTKGDWAVRLDYTTDAFRVYRLDQHVGRLINNTALASQSIWVEVAGWTSEK